MKYCVSFFSIGCCLLVWEIETLVSRLRIFISVLAVVLYVVHNTMQCNAMLCNATQFIHISKLHSKACTGYISIFFQPKNDLLLRFSGGPAVICIMGLKLLRSSFSDPSRQHIVLLWTVLFFHFDYSHSSETFVVDYFFMSIFISKVSGKQRLVALVPQSFYACHLS